MSTKPPVEERVKALEAAQKEAMDDQLKARDRIIDEYLNLVRARLIGNPLAPLPPAPAAQLLEIQIGIREKYTFISALHFLTKSSPLPKRSLKQVTNIKPDNPKPEKYQPSIDAIPVLGEEERE